LYRSDFPNHLCGAEQFVAKQIFHTSSPALSENQRAKDFVDRQGSH
jgi:hypothetical protein